jgi:hypothetical protein
MPQVQIMVLEHHMKTFSGKIAELDAINDTIAAYLDAHSLEAWQVNYLNQAFYDGMVFVTVGLAKPRETAVEQLPPGMGGRILHGLERRKG